jgi:hypothetical protein
MMKYRFFAGLLDGVGIAGVPVPSLDLDSASPITEGGNGEIADVGSVSGWVDPEEEL